MRVAVVGSSGQLGTDLVQRLGEQAVPLTHQQVEVADLRSVRSALEAVRPDVVVNCAAYNFVDRAEDEPQAAWAVNALGPRNLAVVCSEQDAVLVHVSTDHVFGLDDGRQRPYTETDPPGPVSVYGVSKLAGEYFVRSLCPRSFVVRTCGLYGLAGTSGRGKGNFVETMLRLAREGRPVRVVNDQRCTPTSTTELAAAVVRLFQTERFGMYHVTNAGDCTWFEFACEIFRLEGLDVPVVPIRSEQFGARARRPRYSVLDCSKLSRVTGVVLSDWRAALADYLRRRRAERDVERDTASSGTEP